MTTPKLKLPELTASQSQKHVTHNEALFFLDTLVQLAVIDKDLSTPPGSPTLGATYIVGSAPTGSWTGKTNQVASYDGSGWIFFVPVEGWNAWVNDEDTAYYWDGSAWTSSGGGGGLGPAAFNDGTVTLLGINGATADTTNRLSINTPAVLLNNAGTSIDMTFNKNAVGNDATLSFKTGFSVRGIIGLQGDDDLTLKVSPDGSTFNTALILKAATGRAEVSQPIEMVAQSALPTNPGSGKLAIYPRTRAGQIWLDVLRPSGRDFPLQPHFGVNRIARWSPSSGTTVNSDGMPRTAVGTASTPTLAATNLGTSMRRWTMTSAATANAAAEDRSAGWVCWRGNAAGLGGFTYVNRLSLTTLQATGMGFFGLYGSTSALATTLTLAAVINCIGIGFQLGTHTNWQLVHNDGTGAPTLTDLGANFPINTTHVLTLFIMAAPNAGTVGVRVVNETTGNSTEFTISTDMPATNQFLSPHNYMNNAATAAAVAYDCAGVYIETDV